MGAKEIICLGDVGGYYSAVNECCETLRTRNIFTLLGNHDWYLISEEGCPRSDAANRCISYQKSVLTPENRAWLQSLKPMAEKHGLQMVHGGWNDPIDEYVNPTREYFAARTGTNFVSGHTHVPIIRRWGAKQYCNPGAVGQPRDGDARASFATWDGADFALHRVAYALEQTQAQMAQAGFPAYFYENLETGTRIGGKIDAVPAE